MEVCVNKKLPARPNLEHLRNQSKTLLSRMREGDAAAARVFSKYHPPAKGLSPEQVRGAGFRLADAQSAVARKSGFAAWPGLARYVEGLRSLEGTWAFRTLQIDGQAMPVEGIDSPRLLIDGDRFRMESPEATYEGLFDIDVERIPHTIDIDFVEGPEAGNRCEGIFELDGDQLTFCLGLTGATRPRDFASRPGTGHAFERLERVERARPAGVDGGTAQPLDPPAVPRDMSSFPDDVTPLLAALQGEWIPTELKTAGQALAPAMLAYGSRTMLGTETKVVFGGQTMVHAKVRMNDAASPVEIDYLNLSGPKRGSVSFGIMRWIGDEVVFCMASPGAPRPADFSCEKGSGRTFSRWRRK
jgi:uncharacterized protein (TIGR03067 family)